MRCSAPEGTTCTLIVIITKKKSK